MRGCFESISVPGVVALSLSIGDSALAASRAGRPGRPLRPLAVLRPRALVALFYTLAPATPLEKERERERGLMRAIQKKGRHPTSKIAKVFKSSGPLPFIFCMMTVGQTPAEAQEMQLFRFFQAVKKGPDRVLVIHSKSLGEAPAVAAFWTVSTLSCHQLESTELTPNTTEM